MLPRTLLPLLLSLLSFVAAKHDCVHVAAVSLLHDADRLRGLRYTTLQSFKHVESSPPVRRSRSGDIDFAFGISIDLVLVVAHQNKLMLAPESIVLCECVTHRPCCSYDAALCLPRISKCLS